YYVVDALGDLHERTAKIREEYHFGDDTPTAPPAAKKEHPARHWRVWNYFVAGYRHPGTQFRRCCCSISGFLYGSSAIWKWNPDQREVKQAWLEFDLHRRLGRRFPRCLFLSMIYFLLFGLLWLLFDHVMVQARGSLARATSFAILLLSGGTLIFLLVIVVDSTFVGNRL